MRSGPSLWREFGRLMEQAIILAMSLRTSRLQARLDIRPSLVLGMVEKEVRYYSVQGVKGTHRQ